MPKGKNSINVIDNFLLYKNFFDLITKNVNHISSKHIHRNVFAVKWYQLF